MINCLLIDPRFQAASQLSNLLAQTASFRLLVTLNEPQSIAQLDQYDPHMPVFCVLTPDTKLVFENLITIQTKLLVILSENKADATLAFDFDAVDFLTLPIDPSRIKHCLDKLTRFSQYIANAYRDVMPRLRQLTEAEKRVLYRIGEQKTTRQIAEELFVSSKTIETHRNNIRVKLEFAERRPLTPFAIMVVDQGLLT